MTKITKYFHIKSFFIQKTATATTKKEKKLMKIIGQQIRKN